MLAGLTKSKHRQTPASTVEEANSSQVPSKLVFPEVLLMGPAGRAQHPQSYEHLSHFQERVTTSSR